MAYTPRCSNTTSFLITTQSLTQQIVLLINALIGPFIGVLFKMFRNSFEDTFLYTKMWRIINNINVYFAECLYFNLLLKRLQSEIKCDICNLYNTFNP